MAVMVSVSEIREFYIKNQLALRDEYRLVADEEDTGVALYITEEDGLPYFLVEVDGDNEYEARASSETEIEKVYSQLLNFYICETDDDEVLSTEDFDRLEEIYDATIEYLSVLLEREPDEYFDDNCLEEIALAFEGYLYDAYRLSVRHPNPYRGEVEG